MVEPRGEGKFVVAGNSDDVSGAESQMQTIKMFVQEYQDLPLGELVSKYNLFSDDSDLNTYFTLKNARLGIENLLVTKFNYSAQELQELKR